MIGIRCVLVVGILLFVCGCPNKQAQPRRAAVNPDPAADAQSENEAILNSALAALAQKNDTPGCRGALQQLDDYLSRLTKDERPEALDKIPAERWQNQLGLDAGELVEVNSDTFTLLDASYLEQALLLYDAARALDVDELPPLQRADAAFAWVIRQVRLVEVPVQPLPPRYVLRRGTGNSFERSLTFVALLRQLDLDGCLVAFKPEPNQAPDRLLAGVLVDKDIYLFDARMGLPVPGPKLGDIATLAQLRKQPDVLNRLTLDARFPYDVTANHLANAEIYLGFPLSALSARMRFLEGVLTNHRSNRIDLWSNPAALQEKFQKADQAVPVQNWFQPGDPSSPTRLLRLFLPPQDGGLDQVQALPARMLPGYADNADEAAGLLGLNRQKLFEYQLVPWTAQPPLLRLLPGNVRQQTRELFGKMFQDLHGPARDQLLRGQLDAAEAVLGEKRGQFKSIVSREDPDLAQRLDLWIKSVRSLQVRMIELEKEAGADSARRDANQQFVKLMEQGLPLIVHAMHLSAAGPYDEQLKYQLGLCKQEKALRRQGRLPKAQLDRARNDWQAAADWWSLLARERPGTPAAAAARALHAEALLALGDRDAAVGLLENVDGPLTALEKTGRLHRAHQIKQK